MIDLTIYDFQEITLDELKANYPFPDYSWEAGVDEDTFIHIEKSKSIELIAKSKEILKDPRLIFFSYEDDENGDIIEPDQAVKDFRDNIEAKHYQQIHVRAEYIRFLDERMRELQSPEPKPKQNKSLLLDGKGLNLSERFKIANEVLGIDKKIRTLNIPDLEKYRLLAYILGCDKDNARNIMNGTYDSKDRDLTSYFDDLGLNK